MTWFLLMNLLSFFVNGEKRLLLGDPSLLQSQLHELEVKFKDLMSKYSEQQAALNDLRSEHSAQQTTLNDLKSKYQSLLVSNNDLGTKLQSVKGGAIFVRWGKKVCPSMARSRYIQGLSVDPVFSRLVEQRSMCVFLQILLTYLSVQHTFITCMVESMITPKRD
ncbi:uncharacterized protein LOC134239269 [Saccostrea cucullata]|uniref:uncharacterized protein LOC134239269 n=1 Tax=Saccostrea cuccullata TaxID=36930 RepID=UPI002ED5030E